MSLEDFLKEQSGGEGESGRFTVNHARALELMRTYQLPEPRAYVLKLVQWAVACQPSLIEIRADHEHVTVRHDGQPVADEVLAAILDARVDFHHLSRGLYGALGLAPAELLLTTGGRRYELISGKQETVNGEQETVTVLGLRKRPLETSPMVRRALRQRWATISVEGPLQTMIWDATGLAGLEAGLLRTFCYWCKVPLRLNGKFLNRPGDANFDYVWNDPVLAMTDHNLTRGNSLFVCHFGEGSTEVLAACPSQKLKLVWAEGEQEVEPGAREVLPHITINGAPAATALGYSRHFPATGLGRQIYFLRDGVVIDSFTETARRSSFAFFSAGNLRCGADGFGLLRNAEFEAYLADLRGRLDFFDATFAKRSKNWLLPM
ncbi:MAG: hypothetical protein KC910_14885 [Candidatus Eremiobacteraeota bacterium]|nr:hypothetical protein [Candidatus Eremiobacteraeota bacterium]